MIELVFNIFISFIDIVLVKYIRQLSVQAIRLYVIKVRNI